MRTDGTGLAARERMPRPGAPSASVWAARAGAAGRNLASSWRDSSVRVIDGERNQAIVRRVPQPADIGVDTRRNRVAIPVAAANRVELWTIPPAAVR
jgi:hypothetical protein